MATPDLEPPEDCNAARWVFSKVSGVAESSVGKIQLI